VSGVRDPAREVWTALAGIGAAASAALGMLVLGCVFLAVAAPREGLTLRTRALQAELAGVRPLGRSVYGTQPYSGFEAVVHPADAPAVADTGASLASNLAATGLPLSSGGDWSGLTTGFQPVTGAPAAFYINTPLCSPPRMEVLYRDKLLGYAPLVAGRYPGSAPSLRAGALFQVAVTQATAARFELKVGSQLGIGQGITLVVTGIVRPADAGSPFWTADPVAGAPQLEGDTDPNCPPYWDGALFVGPAELGPLESEFNLADMTVTWDYPMDLRSVDAIQAVALQRSLDRAESGVGRPGTMIANLSAAGTPVTFTSGVSTVLASFIAQDQAIGGVLNLLTVSLAAVAAVVLLLAAFVIAEHRGAEFALMQARGAGRLQLAGIVLRAGARVAIPAAAAGAALAVFFTPGASTSLSWWLAAATIAVAVAGPPAVAASRRRGWTAAAGEEPAQETGFGSLRRLIIEATLTGAAVGGVVLLRQRARPGSDLYTELAPVLVALVAALLAMRCYPVVLRLLIKVTRRFPGAAAFVGLARAARAAPRAALPAFALVLALSAVGFGTMMRASVARGEVAASWQNVGADAVVNASASAAAVTPAVMQAIGAVPGAGRVAVAALTSGRTARGVTFEVAAVSPREYAAFIAATPLPAFPAAKLALPGGTQAAAPVPVLASAAAAAALGTGPARVSVGSRVMEVKVAGVIPALAWVQGAVVVLPVAALSGTTLSGATLSRTTAAPNIVLVVGSHLDGARLAAVVHRDLPGAFVLLRSSVLAAHTGAPLPNGGYRAMAMGSVAAAGLTILVIVIALVLSARSRAHTLVRLEVMGLAQQQARWLVVAEVLPQIMVAVVGGVASAAMLAPLLAPAFDLSALTGSISPVRVSAQPVPLGIVAGGLVAVAVLTVAVQTAVARRRAAFRFLRVGG
jgi:putative ABC transport system permease protein